jgi:hypothetical protein
MAKPNELIPMKIAVLSLLICLINSATGFSQSFNLQQMLKENKLISFKNHIPVPLNEKDGVSGNRIVWLKDIRFSTGTIEIDLRGKDVPQQSFLGVAFHGVDTITYDAIYFRPFNFQSSDPVRKIHAVQYISQPEFTWEKLRGEKNGIYEKGIIPPPSPTNWFHAKIVVSESTITVYVNEATTPSLQVDKLNSRTDGMIGLWNYGLDGDFANLRIKK